MLRELLPEAPVRRSAPDWTRAGVLTLLAVQTVSTGLVAAFLALPASSNPDQTARCLADIAPPAVCAVLR